MSLLKSDQVTLFKGDWKGAKENISPDAAWFLRKLTEPQPLDCCRKVGESKVMLRYGGGRLIRLLKTPSMLIATLSSGGLTIHVVATAKETFIADGSSMVRHLPDLHLQPKAFEVLALRVKLNE